jgi:hypothetical protein
VLLALCRCFLGCYRYCCSHDLPLQLLILALHQIDLLLLPPDLHLHLMHLRLHMHLHMNLHLLHLQLHLHLPLHLLLHLPLNLLPLPLLLHVVSCREVPQHLLDMHLLLHRLLHPLDLLLHRLLLLLHLPLHLLHLSLLLLHLPLHLPLHLLHLSLPLLHVLHVVLLTCSCRVCGEEEAGEGRAEAVTATWKMHGGLQSEQPSGMDNPLACISNALL